MTMLIATQVIGDGALTVYLINETTLRQRLLPPEALGRAAATWQVATGLLTPAGALAGAALAESIGMRPTLWLLAIGIALAPRGSSSFVAQFQEGSLWWFGVESAASVALKAPRRACATRSSAPCPYCSSATGQKHIRLRPLESRDAFETPRVQRLFQGQPPARLSAHVHCGRRHRQRLPRPSRRAHGRRLRSPRRRGARRSASSTSRG